MTVEIHRENYQAYVERNTIMDTQQQILHHISGSQSTAPTMLLLRLPILCRGYVNRFAIGVGVWRFVEGG
jgi:hypothetical protein